MGMQAEKVVTQIDHKDKKPTVGNKNLNQQQSDSLISKISQPKIYVPLIGLLFICIAPLSVNEYYQNILNSILLFAIAGVSWNIFGGYARQVSIGHALFFGIGAYTSTILLMKYGISPWIGMFAGGLISVAVGY